MMKRLALVSCLAALAIAGCGSNDNPAGPSNTTVFTVNVLPSNEVPPVTDAQSSGRATAVITVHSDTNIVDFNVNMNSFPAGTVITNAHIHPGAAGTNGSVIVGVNATFPMTLANGSGTISVSTSAQTAESIASILAAPQNFYFNIHSSAHPGGVARGQLR
jgi:CHRD domain-containing protein